MKIVKNEIIATEGKYIARKGSDAYFTRCTLLPKETLESFVEVDEIPTIEDLSNYNEEVNNLIRNKYSLSEELGILRQRDTKPEEFAAYNEYAEQCKRDIKLKRELTK